MDAWTRGIKNLSLQNHRDQIDHLSSNYNFNYNPN